MHKVKFHALSVVIVFLVCNAWATAQGEPPSALVVYDLPGDAAYQSRLYPAPALINPQLGLTTPEKVIAHFTASSLHADGIKIVPNSLKVTDINGSNRYRIHFETEAGHEARGQHYATMHPAILDRQHAGLAVAGAEKCQNTPGCWNPMSGYPVNKHDGDVKWYTYLPLGMPIVNHKALTLLHYPPYVAMQNADYLHNMTLERWQRLITAAGIPPQEHLLYDAILDVNPIAAPGSGQSEYPNDYFPIMLSSVYFDDDNIDKSYIRAMMELMLNPPHNHNNPYTLPLLVAGSPLYDPQAPGWFRVRYRDQMPTNPPGIPQMKVLQAGAVKIDARSNKATPYMGANHMIAAGVTGDCTNDPGAIPDIRRYEAEDLVTASFLKQYNDAPGINPADAKRNSCLQWFGNSDCRGAPKPAADKMLTICTLAQVDLYFNHNEIAPMCTQQQAQRWCQQATNQTYDPCFENKAYPNCYTPPSATK